MNFKDKLKANWRNGAVGAASTVLLGLLFLITPLGHGLTNLSYDFPFAFRSAGEPEGAAIIYMDDESYKQLNQPFDAGWSRSLHAQLIRRLNAAHAKAIVFDILWDQVGTNKQIDLKQAQAMNQELADAIANAQGKVVAASSAIYSDAGGLDQWILQPPVSPIGEVVANGVVEIPAESDGALRHMPHHKAYPTLAWRTAEVVGHVPNPRAQTGWLNYYGPREYIEHYSYFQALSSDGTPPNAFSNKVVFVGKGAVKGYQGTGRDDWPTPYTRWTSETTAGVEIQATAYLNLVGGVWLNKVSSWTQVFLCLFLGTVFGYGFTLVRPWIATALALGGVVAVTAVALWMVWKTGWWFSWLVVGVVEIPTALAWAILANTRKVYQEKERLEETLKTARSAPYTAPTIDSSASESQTIVDPTAGETDGSVATDSLGGGSGRVGLGHDSSARTIGDHELVQSVGKGAYGEVWLAKNLVGIYRAMKVIHRKNFEHEGPYLREFRGLRKFMPISMTHPGLVQIVHVGNNETEGYFYYIMEVGDDEETGQIIEPGRYKPKNLAKDLQKRGKFPVAETIELALSLSAALEHLHQQGLIHRDIKPANIIFVKGVPKLADIGLVTDREDTQHSAATVVGTFGYMAPEGPGTAAADVFSLGKVLYEVAMGRDCNQYPDLPSTLLDRSDGRDLLKLNEVILKACEYDSRKRYQTAAALHADLLALQTRLAAVPKA